jgi:hypothetical protein
MIPTAGMRASKAITTHIHADTVRPSQSKHRKVATINYAKSQLKNLQINATKKSSQTNKPKEEQHCFPHCCCSFEKKKMVIKKIL